jgi:hypothetical protein
VGVRMGKWRRGKPTCFCSHKPSSPLSQRKHRFAFIVHLFSLCLLRPLVLFLLFTLPQPRGTNPPNPRSLSLPHRFAHFVARMIRCGKCADCAEGEGSGGLGGRWVLCL